MNNENNSRFLYVVRGNVTDGNNRALGGLLVKAYDRDLRSESVLGECLTDAAGAYKITYTPESFATQEKKSADLYVKVFTRAGTTVFETEFDRIIFNAADYETIDISISSPIQPEGNEFDRIVREISGLLGKVKISELEESDKNRDISFLSKETGVGAEKLEHVVVAHRLYAESKIDAAFFYGLLRKNTLLKNKLDRSLRMRLSIDINTEVLPLLYEAALTNEDNLAKDSKAAVKESIVPTRVGSDAKKNIERLKKYRQKAQQYYDGEHMGRVVNLVSRFVTGNKAGEIAKLFKENRNNPAEFLKKINDESFFKSASTATDARIAISLASLLGSNEAIISEIKRTEKIKKPEDVRKLAALGRSDWKKLINKSMSKIKVDGRPLDKKLVDFHAASLTRKMEREFPTAAFSARLEKEKKPVFETQKQLATFFKKHADFDLRKSNIDLFLNKKKLTGAANDTMRSELKSAQRIFRLVPDYRKASSLLKKNIHSAHSISAMGEARFVREVAPEAGLTNKEARTIFKKAETTNTAAMLIAGELQDTIRSMDISALEIKSLPLKLEAVTKDFPNLQSLFKMADVCACEHCRSVYSPAAYMVEILEFLDNRSVTDLTAGPPPSTGNIAKDVLFERRPDLGEIDLGCENANTPIPYIDLVCELLEEEIAPDPGVAFTGVLSDGLDPLTGKISAALFAALTAANIPVTDQALVFHTETPSAVSSATLPHYLRDKEAVCKIVNTGGNNYVVTRLRQTLSSAEELAAAPAYVNQGAYDELRDNSFAFTLPFDLSHTEAKAYFSRFDIDRYALMDDFQAGGIPSDEAIAAERLGLTDAERNLIVTADSGNQQDYWNTASANASTELNVVDTFLTKTGLEYTELELLLTLDFIDPTDKLFIKHGDIASCDTTNKTIANLDDVALDRIHRFLRLQKKTGWAFETVAEIIRQEKLGDEKLDSNCLIQAASLVKISTDTGIKLEQLLGFFGEFPFVELTEDAKTPLYQQVFLNKAKNGFIDEGLLPEEVDGTQLLSNFKTSLSVALQVSEQDLDKLLVVLPGPNLDFLNLSSLYASSLLVRKLKLKVEDFLILRELSAIDPSDSPAKTLELLDVISASRQFALKPVDLKFMLRHDATNLVDREITVDKIKVVLDKLQVEYQKAEKANLSPFDPELNADEQKEALENLLSRLPDVAEEDVKAFVGFIDSEWSSAANAKLFVDEKLLELFDTTAIKSNIDLLDAAIPANLEARRNDLVKSFLDSISTYQYNAEIRTALQQTIATTFKASPEFADKVLINARLRQPLPGTAVVGDLLLTDDLLTIAVTEVAFQQQYDAVRLLHKLFPLINSFKFADETEVEWFLKNNEALGWFVLDAIPYKPLQTDADFAKYSSFSGFVQLSKQLTPVPDPADAENPITFFSVAEMLLPASATTRAEWIVAFSLLNEYPSEDVDAIDAHLFAAFDLTQYRLLETWKSMATCTEHLRKMGCTVTQVEDFIQPVLTDAEAGQLRTALKARYDEDTWLSTLKEITDAIRPQKRNALVAYLLATNPEMEDENDLYDYFLVDVLMESCMPSSRIVQAHGTIQLFVQRCLMGLEPKAAADVDNDPKWIQWKWMKNYRVWEANRKVFLYPENWIEAELRDDKSFLFQELEDELLQNELNEFTAEDALIKYVEKLDNIAFLEVVATWYQVDIRTMHVFARSKGGDPAIYYYRRFEDERSWTPWEKVELDITGDHLLAFMRNDRLCLAWPVFSEEADPSPTSTVPKMDDQNSQTAPVDKPKRKLVIQLAISEFANEKWQQKKVSKEGIKTPSTHVSTDLPRDKYNLLYFQFGEQIWLFSSDFENDTEFNNLNGIFNIAGCKGYPELVFQGDTPFVDFFPDFKDASLKIQRYKELNVVAGDELAVRNIISTVFYTLLTKTPGNFRLSYPLQMTSIDIVLFFFQYFLSLIFRKDRGGKLKLPLGTLLPYFMEDSSHAYVIVPGFYRTDKDEMGEPIYVKRTASNVFQLFDDINALFKKYLALYLANPLQDMNVFWTTFWADPDTQEIVDEIVVYFSLQYGEQFKNMYHPLVCPLRTTLYRDGVDELMKRETQLQVTPFNFDTTYQPTALVPLARPVEDIDFSSDGSYSGYNWELFFHIPFLLATRLTKDQKFEEALTWFHYVFNPTGALSGDVPQKYWVTKPFFQRQSNDYINQRIDTLLYKIADPNTPEMAELEFAIDEWRENPFQPHVIARFRPVAYQKALLMKYIDNLTEWGDYLFRQDTMESIVQATQMYILADKLLGPKPRTVPSAIKMPYETYNQVERRLDAFGNALIDLENILPDLSVLPEGGAELPPAPVTLSTLYFCIPQNDKMLEVWDRVEDRLFKIRNCQNIDGIERSLALFAPPIDPGMLVRAAAAGLDISSILAGMNAPRPNYRFNMIAQKAVELVGEVRALGGSLLQALEKKDAEAMSLLRSQLEIKALNAVRDMKVLQIDEAIEQIEILKKTKIVTTERYIHYVTIPRIIANEQLNLDKLDQAVGWQTASNIVYTLGAGLALVPDFALGVSGFGGSPVGSAKFGGSLLAHSTDAVGKGLSIFSAIASYEANRASIFGGYDRRFSDWKLQERIAKRELDQIDQQITAAEIRKELAETDLKNHDLQIENAKMTDEFMYSKYTRKELYEWMIGQTSAVYFRAYKLAYDTAKKAERCYRFELGNDDTFIGFGYWDSLKKGLQSADLLLHDIKRMETSYLDKNKREYEVTKHLSLAMLDPLALVRLRATGTTDFEVPEAFYDMDHPGQYFRRIKSVSLSLPCIAGPYTSVSAKLSLVSNKYRKNTAKAQGAGTPKEEYEEVIGNDERFVYNVGAIQSIAASNSQNDSGMFELNFRDDRYLPFEGCGAVGSWRLELPAEVRQFAYETISDVILHVKYTAREGGSTLKNLAATTLKEKLDEIQLQLAQTGLHVALNMKNDMPNDWNLLKADGSVNLTIDKTRLPYYAQSISSAIENVVFVVKATSSPAMFTIMVDGADVNLAEVDTWQLCRGSTAAIDLDTPFELSLDPPELVDLEDMVILVKYSF